MRKTRNPLDRFNEKWSVNDSGCHIWNAGVKSNGYGQFTLNGKEDRAHRASWILHNGQIPDGLHVLHKCDNPLCVNPDHLFLGSPKDNMTDKVQKGRCPKGLTHTAAKLSAAEILDLRSRIGTARQTDIGAMFGVSDATVSMIKNFKRYSEVTCLTV